MHLLRPLLQALALRARKEAPDNQVALVLVEPELVFGQGVVEVLHGDGKSKDVWLDLGLWSAVFDFVLVSASAVGTVYLYPEFA